ncbi:zinc transporter permease subunit ZevB [Pasteurellaceae bacterium LIM206]|nr:zinc transporter permease subunit ZevB [Pasteurellaceae bacterium LIM206]
MSVNKTKTAISVFIFLVLVFASIYLFPWLFSRLISWQQAFNQLISTNLHEIKRHSLHAGWGLILVSFFYGVLHALGPGHGKFIIAGYLSSHESALKKSMKLTFLSSLMQGVVAVSATSIVVVALNLSSAYFKLSQLWLERFAFGLIILLGLRWVYQSGKKLYLRRYKNSTVKPQIRQIHRPPSQMQKIGKNDTALLLPRRTHNAVCGCGHRHVPDQTQLARSTDWKSQFLVIISIGMRPCTGAIFILFLSYMLGLYLWGVFATLAMSLGTGLTLSGFALMVQYARSSAVKLGKWYLSPRLNGYGDVLVKLFAGIFVTTVALVLLYGTSLPSSGGAVLFGR